MANLNGFNAHEVDPSVGFDPLGYALDSTCHKP